MKRLLALVLMLLVPSAMAAGDDLLLVNPDLALAIEYSRKCPELVLDDRRAMDVAAEPQRSTPALLADAGETADAFAEPAPAPEPPPPPPQSARPPPAAEEVDCASALDLFGQEGTRIRGLLKLRARNAQ
jgi:hypothetical protein